MPLNPLRSHNSVDQVRQVRMVCDEYGSCWRETNPGEDIGRGVIRGLEGRSIYRHRDWDIIAGGIAIGIATMITMTKTKASSHNFISTTAFGLANNPYYCNGGGARHRRYT